MSLLQVAQAPTPAPAPFSWSDPDWLSAIGQVSAAILTLLAVVVALAVAIGDARGRRRDRDDREAAQARQVFAVTGTDHGDNTGVVMTNYSGEIITMVQPVTIMAPEFHPETRIEWLVSPLSRGHIHTVLPPGGQFTVPYQIVWPEGQGRPPIRHYTVTFEFTDSRGLRWRRTGRDQPIRIRS